MLLEEYVQLSLIFGTEGRLCSYQCKDQLLPTVFVHVFCYGSACLTVGSYSFG